MNKFLNALNATNPDYHPNACDAPGPAAAWYSLCQFCGEYLGQREGHHYGQLMYALLPSILFLHDFEQLCTLMHEFWDATGETAQEILEERFDNFMQALRDSEKAQEEYAKFDE